MRDNFWVSSLEKCISMRLRFPQEKPKSKHAPLYKTPKFQGPTVSIPGYGKKLDSAKWYQLICRKGCSKIKDLDNIALNWAVLNV